MKKCLAALLAACLLTTSALADSLEANDIFDPNAAPVLAPEEVEAVQASAAPAIAAPAAVLMEKSTGTVLYELDSHRQYEPASVTKVMTLLLVFEALDAGVLTLDQPVTASTHATSMGGSQIWLKENEQLTVDEMVKAVTVVSANDCAVALAEAVAGSEEAFVAHMNQRALELGMKDTHFVNCTGLPAEGHLTTAHDIALMSRELILNHPDIRKYSTIWMDSLRDGASLLVNTNKLVRFYPGTTGLKTGSTASALYCLSATAERDGMELIAVVMHAATPDDRFESAKALLSYGFANYALASVTPEQALPPIPVLLGQASTVQPIPQGAPTVLLEKGQAGSLSQSVTLCPDVEAPVEAGQVLGRLTVSAGDRVVAEIPLVAAHAVERLSALGIFRGLLRELFLASSPDGRSFS